MPRNIDTPSNASRWEQTAAETLDLSNPNGDSGFDLVHEVTGEVIQLSNAMLADYLHAKASRTQRLSDEALDRLARATASEVDRSIDLSTPDRLAPGRSITFRQSPAEGSDADLLRRWSEEG